MSEDEALRAIHLAENAIDRERAVERLTFDEAVGLQWALVARRYGELCETGPPAPQRDDGLLAALLHAVAVRADRRPARGARTLSTELAGTAADEPHAAG